MSKATDDWINEPVDGHYKKLAIRIRTITGKVGSRVAARRSGLSHDTIVRLWAGERVSEPYLVRFAIGYGVDANEILELAGLPPLSERERLETFRYLPQDVDADNNLSAEWKSILSDYNQLPDVVKPHVLEHVLFIVSKARNLYDAYGGVGERVIVDLSDEDEQSESSSQSSKNIR